MSQTATIPKSQPFETAENRHHAVNANEKKQNELINPRKRGQRNWTPEQRQQAAARARLNKPWDHSTGPKTAAGKAVSSQNALILGEDPVTRALAHFVREQVKFLKNINYHLRQRRNIARAIKNGTPAAMINRMILLYRVMAERLKTQDQKLISIIAPYVILINGYPTFRDDNTDRHDGNVLQIRLNDFSRHKTPVSVWSAP